MDILPWSKEYAEAFRELVYDWLILNENSRFTDIDFLNEPEQVIANRQGEIKLACPDKEIAGTIVTKFLTQHEAQILFLIVKKEWQQRQIGRVLVMDSLKSLQENGFSIVRTQFDRKHIAALKVFKSCGFELQKMSHGLDNNQTQKTILHLKLKLDKTDDSEE